MKWRKKIIVLEKLEFDYPMKKFEGEKNTSLFFSYFQTDYCIDIYTWMADAISLKKKSNSWV